MGHSKDVLVIGLGRFGSAIVRTLLDRRQRVTVVDISEEKVNKFASKTEYAKVCDTRDEDVLQQLGVNNFDHVVVAIGSSIEASIITTLLLKDMGVENLTVKASNFQHRSALLKLDIPSHAIIMPETEMGEKVAHSISFPIVADYISLLGEKHGLIEMYPNKSWLTNKSLLEVDLKGRYNVMVIAIKRDESIILPNRDTIIQEDDSLLVIGEDSDLAKFEGDL